MRVQVSGLIFMAHVTFRKPVQSQISVTISQISLVKDSHTPIFARTIKLYCPLSLPLYFYWCYSTWAALWLLGPKPVYMGVPRILELKADGFKSLLPLCQIHSVGNIQVHLFDDAGPQDKCKPGNDCRPASGRMNGHSDFKIHVLLRYLALLITPKLQLLTQVSSSKTNFLQRTA